MKPILHPEHIVSSALPDVRNIPDTDIYSFLFEERSYPPQQSTDRVAFIDAPSGIQLTFSQLKEKVNALARGLVRKGIKEHDVVAFFSPNHVL
jgi:long-subunit acyl-CoA synthetase (AMP-forming)